MFIIKRGKIEDFSRSQFVMVQRKNSIRPRRSYQIIFCVALKKLSHNSVVQNWSSILHNIIILGNDIIKRL